MKDKRTIAEALLMQRVRWIRAQGMEFARDETALGMFRKQLKTARIFIIDNVAEYMFSAAAPDEMDICNLGCFRLPFPVCWFEYHFPNKIEQQNGKAVGLPAHARGGRKSFLFGDERTISREAIVRLLQQTHNKPQRGVAHFEEAAAGHQKFRRMVVIGFFMNRNQQMAVDPLSYEVFYTDSGKYVQHRVIAFVPLSPQQAQEAGYMPYELMVAYFALGLLHCKNVQQTELPAPKGIYSHNRQRRRDFLRYHVLTIHSPGASRTRTKGKDISGYKRALHICRGHFKRFDEKPLFGKYRGLYWWSPQVRGSESMGVVEKDYSIERKGRDHD